MAGFRSWMRSGRKCSVRHRPRRIAKTTGSRPWSARRHREGALVAVAVRELWAPFFRRPGYDWQAAASPQVRHCGHKTQGKRGLREGLKVAAARWGAARGRVKVDRDWQTASRLDLTGFPFIVFRCVTEAKYGSAWPPWCVMCRSR